MLSLSSLSLLALAGLVSAQDSFETIGPGPYNNASIWRDANRNPISQAAVQFPLFEKGPQWTWKVSVAAVRLNDNPTPNAQQLSQIYSFEWPNGNNLRDAVAQNPSNLNQSAFCVTVVESLFPKGTTDDYDRNADPTKSCVGPLRSRCVDAIRGAAKKAVLGSNGCKLDSLDLGEITECEWSFQHHYQATTYNLLGPNISKLAVNETFPIVNGEGYAHITTDTYDGSNNTYQERAQSRLQMVIIDSGSVFQPLCTRINPNSDVGVIGNAAAVAIFNRWFSSAAIFLAVAYLW